MPGPRTMIILMFSAFEQIKSPGYEVITVDPNCFYSSDDDDIVVDIESDQSETSKYPQWCDVTKFDFAQN